MTAVGKTSARLPEKTTPRFEPMTAQMTIYSPFFDMTSVLQLLAISDADESAKNLFPHPFLRPRWYSERLVSQQADIQENHQRRKKIVRKKIVGAGLSDFLQLLSSFF